MPVSRLINVRVPVALQKELQDLSRSEHVPVSDLIRDSLREFLAVRRFRKLSKDVKNHAKKSGFVTDDDILGLKS
jgi:Arc/MetJ-type ribon-helix-helix transcriptional regulator